MRVAGLISLAGAVAALVVQERTIPTDNLGKPFIVESAQHGSLDALIDEIEASNLATVVKVYDSPIFSGLSVRSTDGDAVSLRALSSVAHVWESKSIPLAAPPVQKRAKGVKVSTTANQNYTIHNMTGVDQLHAAGLTGKGVKIGVISTGVDYTHPALGGCFGAGCRVAGGYDLVGDGCWPLVGCRKAPDGNPQDPNGRGTLTAGVLAGNDPAVGYYGVAPGATLYVYKVIGSDTNLKPIGFNTIASPPATDDETLMEALMRAYNDGVDIITAFPITIGGYGDDALSTLASRLVDQNIVITFGAGETQNYGPFFTYNGGAGTKALAVAPVMADETVAAAFVVTITVGGASSKEYVPFQDLLGNRFSKSISNWPIVPITLSKTVAADACTTVKKAPVNTIPLVRLGGCDAATKQANLEAAGYKYILFYTVDANPDFESVTADGSSVYEISNTDGETIVDAYLKGGKVTGDFSQDYFTTGPPAQGGIDPNVNWGPRNDLRIKPDVAAPGTSLWSTFLNKTYQSTIQGDEVAAGYVAGIAALYIEKHGGRKTTGFNATSLAMRIISSGSPLKFVDVNNYTTANYNAPVAQVGTGLVNATKVVNYSSALGFAKFELNDTAHFQPGQAVDITNGAAVDVTYTFQVVPAIGVEAWSSQFQRVARQEEIGLMALKPQIALPSGTFKVGAGKTVTAKFNFTAPAKGGNLPIYSGLILVNSSLGESLSIPYLGLNANLHDFFPRIFAPSYPYFTSGLYNKNVTNGASFSFNFSLAVQSFPKFIAVTNWGTEELRWDILDGSYTDANWAYPPVKGQNHFLGSATYWDYSQEAWYFDPADTLVTANISSFPLTGVRRSFALSLIIPTRTAPDIREWWWLGTLADGTTVAPGSYKMRVAALRPFGDRAKVADWDITTLAFSVTK